MSEAKKQQAARGTVLVLVGPTGVGKTAVSLVLARQLNGEVVNADSRQVYRYMDIGTAKPEPALRRQVPHHLMDFLDPDQEYSAGRYLEDARRVVADILSRWRVPLVVGGSGLYVRALLEGFFGRDARDPRLRSQLELQAAREGARALYEELCRVDPACAEKTHPNNLKRIIRALEVYRLTGKPISYWQAREKDPAPFPYLKVGLTLPREVLYRRIEQRVEEMFARGLVKEVARLLEMGYSPQLNALNSVGYREVIAYLEGKIDFDTCKELVKRNTRRFAKRQLTWFRREANLHWVAMSETDSPEQVASRIAALYRTAEAGRDPGP